MPLFFERFPEAVIMVGGSDGRDDYEVKCSKNCTKKCTAGCKNFDRRIRTYRGFVNKYFDILCKEYIFFGRFKDDEDAVQYNVGKQYDEILVYKKK